MKGANREAEMVQASLLRQLREAKPGQEDNLATANVHVGCIATLDCRVARHHTGNRAEDQMNEPEVFSESSVFCAMKDCACRGV
jgi:hypothetical protein